MKAADSNQITPPPLLIWDQCPPWNQLQLQMVARYPAVAKRIAVGGKHRELRQPSLLPGVPVADVVCCTAGSVDASTTDDGSVCWVCQEGELEAPGLRPTGCACRGSGGHAHLRDTGGATQQ